jgi:hypothetical protein
MGYSAKVVLRRPARKDGSCQVRLIVILDGHSVPVALKVAVAPGTLRRGSQPVRGFLTAQGARRWLRDAAGVQLPADTGIEFPCRAKNCGKLAGIFPSRTSTW